MNRSSLNLQIQQGKTEQPAGWRQLDSWRQLLDRCSRKPTPKRVHRLRVATLRIQAELEHWPGEQGLDGRAVPAAVRWGKLAEKLRDALSPVREADVWIDMLEGLRASMTGPGEYSSRSIEGRVRKIERLERRLKQKRSDWERKLSAEIDDLKERLYKTSKDVEAHPLSLQATAGGAKRVSDQFAVVAAEFPSLNADNLHEFRKRIKKVRYLAEVFAASDAEAGRQAISLKKMQSAAGEWHDWQALARRARRALGHRARRDDLVELLETLAAESLGRAIDVCEQLSARMLKIGEQSGDFPRSSPQKLSVRSVEAVGAAGERRLA